LRLDEGEHTHETEGNAMRKTLALAALSTAIVGGAALAAVQDFTVTNKTGWDIEALYVESSGERDWGNDVLGDVVLPDGSTREISFSGYAEDDCKFDILLQDRAGTQWTVEGIDLCKITDVTFAMDGGTVMYSETEVSGR
jgi:hypothetical protein